MSEETNAPLHDILRNSGPLPVSLFMAQCLGHPLHGYYMTQEPFGVAGDFTTAPEISQLFGEMLAVWAMTQAPLLPSPLQVVELGPGRGSLMQDFWRGLSAQPALRDSLTIHLVEFSPRLRALQQEKLQGLPVTWHENLETIPQRPSIILANEFFDALPIEQAVYHDNAWYQRLVVAEEEDFIFTLGPQLQGIHVPKATDGAIYEYAPAAAAIMEDLCYFLRKNKGVLLAIDYGDDVELDQRVGETLQALHKHQPVSPLSLPGLCDVTAHVAFQALQQVATENGCDSILTTQREFLTRLGIRLRAEKLLVHATLDQARTLKSGLERLIAPDQMGDLFKVLEVQAL